MEQSIGAATVGTGYTTPMKIDKNKIQHDGIELLLDANLNAVEMEDYINVSLPSGSMHWFYRQRGPTQTDVGIDVVTYDLPEDQQRDIRSGRYTLDQQPNGLMRVWNTLANVPSSVDASIWWVSNFHGYEELKAALFPGDIKPSGFTPYNVLAAQSTYGHVITHGIIAEIIPEDIVLTKGMDVSAYITHDGDAWYQMYVSIIIEDETEGYNIIYDGNNQWHSILATGHKRYRIVRRPRRLVDMNQSDRQLLRRAAEYYTTKRDE